MAARTTTATQGGGGSIALAPDSSSRMLPQKLPGGFLGRFPKLSAEQAGHLRHFHNLAAQPDGEWRHMGAQDPGQEWLDGYRYQLAVMAYAAGAAHYHRLPALRSVFAALLRRLVAKMLRREVWGYWYLTSQSGRLVDPDIEELRKPWPDPIQKENIMYSGHLLLMVSLYAMLFDDDRYDKPDALVFNWNPIFWGMGPETFAYSRASLQQAIIDEMERTKWMGVCCEPNSVFIVCNQFPLIAIRYNDVRDGTNAIDGILKKYTEAWNSRNGFIQSNGLFASWWRVKQENMVNARSIGFTAWACAMMNAWNAEFVHSIYASTARGSLTRFPDGRVNLNSAAVAAEIRALASAEGADPEAPSTLASARQQIAAKKAAAAAAAGPPPLGDPDLGYVIKWASEVGSQEDIEGLLRHADQYLNPTWERGGLFYPRRDGPPSADEDGNWTAVDPFTGNAAIAYGRLNVRDGQKKMWERPWDREHFASHPFVDGVDLGSGVDFLRAGWDGEAGALVLTARAWDGSSRRIGLIVRNLPAGTYGIYEDGGIVRTVVVSDRSDAVELPLEVGGAELDVVLLKQV